MWPYESVPRRLLRPLFFPYSLYNRRNELTTKQKLDGFFSRQHAIVARMPHAIWGVLHRLFQCASARYRASLFLKNYICSPVSYFSPFLLYSDHGIILLPYALLQPRLYIP